MESTLSRKITLNHFLVFEPEKKRITGRGNPAIISASASLCFELLIENVGELVTHQQFFDYAWRRFGMEPTSTSLYQNISSLRRALSKAGLQEDIIRTMPRRGFILSPQTMVMKENTVTASSATVLSEKNYEPLSSEENTESHEGASPAVLQHADVEDDKDHKTVLPSTRQRDHSPWLPKTEMLLARLSFKNVFFTAITFVSFCCIFIFIKVEPQPAEPVFAHSMDYKGCVIFNNSDAWLNSAELKKRVDDLDINCKDSQYIYMTSFKNADRLSYFQCQHPLHATIRANCLSHYYVKNFNDE
ncbi:winged helix-turn-helix domain-containing protein [Pantoea ananatis]|uniref:winged helix-turn-helix domain-containing protein n=1 Tax=Pantoea ananas TaxID=553 RepID=UPI0004964B37